VVARGQLAAKASLCVTTQLITLQILIYTALHQNGEQSLKGFTNSDRTVIRRVHPRTFLKHRGNETEIPLHRHNTTFKHCIHKVSEARHQDRDRGFTLTVTVGWLIFNVAEKLRLDTTETGSFVVVVAQPAKPLLL